MAELKSFVKRVLLPMAAAAFFLAGAAGAEELDWYLTIPATPGCATAPGQAGKIEVAELHQLWFSAEASVPQPIETREFIFGKPMDCASHLLWARYRDLTEFSEVVFEGYSVAPPYPLKQRIELRNAFIQSLETSDGLPDGRPHERIRLVYGWVEMSSYCIRPQDGTSCGDVTFQHDFSAVP